MSVIVVVPCRAPEVAVTVTVEVVGEGVDGGVDVDDAEPPPQPERTPRPTKANASSIHAYLLYRFLHLNRPKITASAVTGKSRRDSGRMEDDCAAATMVSWVVAAAPEGVTVVGWNEHVASAGNPEHAKLTGELNPFCGVTESVIVPWATESTVSAFGEAARAKLAGADMV